MPPRPKTQAKPSVAPTLWCAIYHIAKKYATNNCHLLQKYTQAPQQLFYNFCRSVGHDEHTFRSYDLMMDRTPTYRVQAEMWPLDQNAGMARTGFQGHGRGWGWGGRGRGHEKLIFYNCEGLGHYSHDFTNPMHPSCKYCTLFDHEIEYCPTLIARIHDKGALPPPLT